MEDIEVDSLGCGVDRYAEERYLVDEEEPFPSKEDMPLVCASPEAFLLRTIHCGSDCVIE